MPARNWGSRREKIEELALGKAPASSGRVTAALLILRLPQIANFTSYMFICCDLKICCLGVKA